jgi:hypothetical protein
MPPAQAVIVWLQKHMPRFAGRILERGRAIYEERGRSTVLPPVPMRCERRRSR